jgi:hypothetical protein
MEDVLDVYQLPYDAAVPVVCLDETNRQLLADTRAPHPMGPDRVARYDPGYARGGVVNAFLVTEPLRGWREVSISARRTRLEFAYCIKDLVDVHYPTAERIRLVMDNLNIHTPAALYEAFPPDEAKRLTGKLDIHYTPKHGSWLNMAELELSALQRQCLDRRLPDQETMAAEVNAWVAARNAADVRIDWRFTTADARIKLKRLYPTFNE